MTKTISKKDLYRKLKQVSDDVMKHGTVYTVLQNSKPAFLLTPLQIPQQKKFKKEDLEKFMFDGSDKKEKNLAKTYKSYLYQK